MTETQRRIQAYKRALPHMKERVMAVALLFVISISMMVSASFAWITLSRAPEVNGLATTIATNGNLEIALSDIDGLAPDDTAVGDGLGDITKTNLKWGNLINLSDPSYGLSDITLRPAAINTRTLLTNPMYAVSYGADGRVTDYFNDFAYSIYDADYNRFTVPDVASTNKGYGVRAISSVKYEDYLGNAFIDNQKSIILRTFNDAREQLDAICNNMKYMQSLVYIVESYANLELNGGDANALVCDEEQVKQLVAMVDDFYICMKTAGDALLEIANMHQYLDPDSQYIPHIFSELSSGVLSTRYEDYPEFKQAADTFKTAWSNTEYAWKHICESSEDDDIDSVFEIMSRGEPVYWGKHLAGPIDKLCKISTATIEDKTVDQLAADKKGAIGIIMGNDKPEAKINDGAIKDADLLLLGKGEHIDIYDKKNIVINIKYIITYPVTPRVITAAYDVEDTPYIGYAQTEAEIRSAAGSGDKGQAVAAETYAMVIDFWVRTNSSNSLLILEGELKYEQDTGTDKDGFSVGRLYSFDTTDEETEELITTYVYKTDDGKLYYNNSSDEVPADSRPADNLLVEVMKSQPSGYEGVNRVWTEEDYEGLVPGVDPNSIVATQGSGSCYIFYATSPEEQEQALHLLSSMRVAFVGKDGSLLATAAMDTEKAVEDAGRVLVPLFLRPNTPIEIDEDGNTESYYITPLVQNEATRITALVYLDGLNLANSDVLSAGSITGQLNVQFGTTDMALDALEDEEVMREAYQLEFNPTSKEFSNTDTEYKLPLELTVIGSKPDSVKGYFVSVLTATQGARQDLFEMEFDEASGKWKTTVEFAGAGKYQLRSIQINGVDYLLDAEDIVTVKVPGTSVTSIRWDDLAENPKVKSVLTAESYYQQSLSLVLNSDSDAAHNVHGVFLGDNGQNVTVNFIKGNGNNYSGTATFSSSGKYTLSYVYVDDVPVPLSDENNDREKILELKLGLTVEVNLMRPMLVTEGLEEGVEPDTILSEVKGNMESGWSFTYTMAHPIEIDVTCEVFDDQNNEITDFKDADLTYGTSSSSEEGNIDVVDLTWDADRGKFVGTMHFQNAGIFSFKNLTVTDTNGQVSFITSAKVAPTITSIPPDEMEYIGKSDDHQDKIVALGSGDRKLDLVLKHATATMLDITVKRSSGEIITFTNIDGTEIGNNLSKFTVNINASASAPEGTQLDGTWTIVGARASTVYYDGVFYAGGDSADDWLDLTPMIEANAPISTEFVNNVYTSVNSASADNNGNISFTTPVLEEKTVNDIVVTLKDYADRNIGDGCKVSISLDYVYFTNGNLVTPSATPNNIIANAENIEITDGNFTIPVLEFNVHGIYKLNSILINVMDERGNTIYTTTSLSGMPTVTVNWVMPNVEIKAISPTGSTYYDTANSDGGGHNSTTIPPFNKTEATVYIRCTTASADLGCLGTVTVHNYTAPTVTIKLSNIGNADKAVMSFGNESHVYNGSNRTGTFEWTSNGDCSRKIGYVNSIDLASDKKTPAGLITSDYIVLTKGGISYTFSVNKITINNPY